MQLWHAFMSLYYFRSRPPVVIFTWATLPKVAYMLSWPNLSGGESRRLLFFTFHMWYHF